jgi:hypothetical protein
MSRLRVAGGVVALGGVLLIISPYQKWLGIDGPGLTRSFSLIGSLRELQRGDLLGPGMSSTWVVVAGSLALLMGALSVSPIGVGRTRLPAIGAIVLGAATGAYVAYLHGSLEYGALAIADVNTPHVRTTPGPGLFLAVAGAAAALIGGLIQVWTAEAGSTRSRRTDSALERRGSS